MDHVNRKKYPRIIVATVVALLLVCGLYVLVPNLLRLEPRADAHTQSTWQNNLAHVLVSPIAETPVTPETDTPEPPTAVPDFPTATNTPIAPAPPQVTPVTQEPAEQPQPPDQTPSNTIPTPVTPEPPEAPEGPTSRPPTHAPSVATPVTPVVIALAPTQRHLPWEMDCSRPNILTCNPPALNVGDLRSDWQESVRAAARTWTNAATPFYFVERTFTGSARTQVPSFFGGIPFQTIRLAPGEVRFVQLSRIYNTEPSLRAAFNAMFGQRRVIAAVLGYPDPNNPGKRLASLVILNDHYPLAYSWSTLPANSRIDVRSVALHELGHVAGLEHTTAASDVMFSGPEDTALFLSKRVLTSNDIANLAQLYRIPGPGTLTATPDGSSYPPGVYVVSIQPQPENPKRKQRVPFLVTLLNTTGSTQRYSFLVQIVEHDGHTFGETNAQNILLSPGTTSITTPDNWGVNGPGGCIDLSARPFFRNEDNSRTQFPWLDGTRASIDFSVCP